MRQNTKLLCNCELPLVGFDLVLILRAAWATCGAQACLTGLMGVGMPFHLGEAY